MECFLLLLRQIQLLLKHIGWIKHSLLYIPQHSLHSSHTYDKLYVEDRSQFAHIVCYVINDCITLLLMTQFVITILSVPRMETDPNHVPGTLHLYRSIDYQHFPNIRWNDRVWIAVRRTNREEGFRKEDGTRQSIDASTFSYHSPFVFGPFNPLVFHFVLVFVVQQWRGVVGKASSSILIEWIWSSSHRENTTINTIDIIDRMFNDSLHPTNRYTNRKVVVS